MDIGLLAGVAVEIAAEFVVGVVVVLAGAVTALLLARILMDGLDYLAGRHFTKPLPVIRGDYCHINGYEYPIARDAWVVTTTSNDFIDTPKKAKKGKK